MVATASFRLVHQKGNKVVANGSPATMMMGPQQRVLCCQFVQTVLHFARKIILWPALPGPQATGKVRASKVPPVSLSMQSNVADAVWTGDRLFLDEALGSHPSSQNKRPTVTRQDVATCCLKQCSRFALKDNCSSRRGTGVTALVRGSNKTNAATSCRQQ